MATEQKSVYKRGADDGLFFGIYLIIMFFSSAFSMAVPFAGLLSMLLVLGVPFLIYRFLRRSYVNDSGTTQFSALWVQGITTFFCGSLISGIVALVYMQWINPDFIATQVQSLIDVYMATDWEEGKEIAKVLTKMIEQNLLPTPINIVIESIWLAVFTGSILSMILSIVVQARKTKNNN